MLPPVPVAEVNLGSDLTAYARLLAPIEVGLIPSPRIAGGARSFDASGYVHTSVPIPVLLHALPGTGVLSSVSLGTHHGLAGMIVMRPMPLPFARLAPLHRSSSLHTQRVMAAITHHTSNASSSFTNLQYTRPDPPSIQPALTTFTDRANVEVREEDHAPQPV
jgi:hypothetical protein